jgi:hypothetical protein
MALLETAVVVAEQKGYLPKRHPHVRAVKCPFACLRKFELIGYRYNSERNRFQLSRYYTWCVSESARE